MNPLELRKIIQVGYSFDQPEVTPLLDARGMPVESVEQPFTATVAFWIPVPQPFKRCAGESKVLGIMAHETQALKDGAIVEHVQDFIFPKQPSADEMRRRLMPVWDGLTHMSLGHLPNGVPIDLKPKLAITLENITKPLQSGAEAP